MKKIVSIFIVIVMTAVTVCACGGGGNKKAFAVSQEAYGLINEAYEVVEEYGSDIYEAWFMGIYDSDEKDFGMTYMAKNLNIDEDDLKLGFAYVMNSNDWDDMTESEKQEAKESESIYFDLLISSSDSVFSVCVETVSAAYKANGKVAEIQEKLDQAKALMKELSEKYSDYEHYPSLKGYYTTTSSFFDFCQNPSGSFEQVKTTIDDYKNSARDYKADLDYIFED